MNEVFDYLGNKVKLQNEDIIVAGISGGPDSMALLNVLITLRKKIGFDIICAHVNHNVRKESEQEMENLKLFCANQKVTFEYMKIEQYSDDNFHNEARTIRYNYFEEIIKKYNANYLMTAHHGDDLVETILMRIVRGSTLKGYGGFYREQQKNGYKLIRPLITVTKEELEQYDIKNNIKFDIDQSNSKDCYTRNRYRKEVLPFIKKEDRNAHLKFLKFSETLLEYNNYIEKQMKQTIITVFQNGILNIEKFLKLEHIMQLKIIYYILEQIYDDDLMIINNTHVSLIMRLITSTKANSLIHLPNNVVFIKSYGIITFKLYEPDADQHEYEIELNDVVQLPHNMSIIKLESSDSKSNNIIRLDSKEIKLPLYVRTKKMSDKIHIKGMEGSKKLGTIFIDEKIPIAERNVWPVVCDSENKILWIPGLKKSIYDKNINEYYDTMYEFKKAKMEAK